MAVNPLIRTDLVKKYGSIDKLYNSGQFKNLSQSEQAMVKNYLSPIDLKNVSSTSNNPQLNNISRVIQNSNSNVSSQANRMGGLNANQQQGVDTYLNTINKSPNNNALLNTNGNKNPLLNNAVSQDQMGKVYDASGNILANKGYIDSTPELKTNFETQKNDIAKSMGYGNYQDMSTKIGDIFGENQFNQYKNLPENLRSDYINNLTQQATVLKTNKENQNILSGQIAGVESKLTGTERLNQDVADLEDQLKKGVTNIDQLSKTLNWDRQKVVDFLNQDFGKYVELKPEVQQELTADIQKQRDQLAMSKNKASQEITIKAQRLKTDYDNSVAEQTRINDLANRNIQRLVALTGSGFSSGATEGINELNRLGQKAITDMTTSFGRGTDDLDRAKTDLIDTYTYNDSILANNMTNLIDQEKNNYFNTLSTIKTKYGDSGDLAKQKITELTAAFVAKVDEHVKSIQAAKQENFDNMIRMNELIMKQEESTLKRQQDNAAAYKEYGLNRSIKDVINDIQSGNLSASQGEAVVAQMKTSAINTLNNAKGFEGLRLGDYFSKTINDYVDAGLTPQQILGAISKSKDFQTAVNKQKSITETQKEGELREVGGKLYTIKGGVATPVSGIDQKGEVPKIEFRTEKDAYGNESTVVYKIYSDGTIVKDNNIGGINVSNLSSGTGGAGVGATISLGGGTDISGLYTGSNGPAFANNNPGNIKDTGFGGTAGGRGGFTKFNTVEEGIQALMDKLDFNKANGVNGVKNGSNYNGNMSLLQYFQKYAPKSDNNNPNAYANAVANNLGISVNTKIKDVPTDKFAIEIMKHENGAVYKELVKRGIISQGTIKTPVGQDVSGKTIYGNIPSEQLDFTASKKIQTTGTPLSGFTSDEIAKFDKATFKPKSFQEEQRYNQYQQAKGSVEGSDIYTQSLALTTGFGTGGEREKIAMNIYNKAIKEGITPQEAKIKLNLPQTENDKSIINNYNQDVSLKTLSTNLAAIEQSQRSLGPIDLGTPIGQLGGMVAFLKTIDPGSVAREGEVASVQNARGVLDSIAMKGKQFVNGDKITPEQAKQIKAAVGKIVEETQLKWLEDNGNVIKELQSQGINPNTVVNMAKYNSLNKKMGNILTTNYYPDGSYVRIFKDGTWEHLSKDGKKSKGNIEGQSSLNNQQADEILSGFTSKYAR